MGEEERRPAGACACACGRPAGATRGDSERDAGQQPAAAADMRPCGRVRARDRCWGLGLWALGFGLFHGPLFNEDHLSSITFTKVGFFSVHNKTGLINFFISLTSYKKISKLVLSFYFFLF